MLLSSSTVFLTSCSTLMAAAAMGKVLSMMEIMLRLLLSMVLLGWDNVGVTRMSKLKC